MIEIENLEVTFLRRLQFKIFQYKTSKVTRVGDENVQQTNYSQSQLVNSGQRV